MTVLFTTLSLAQSARPVVSPAARLLDSARVLIAKATPSGDVAMLHTAQALLERSMMVAPTDAWMSHYLGFALYREATLRMGRDNDEVSKLLERADSVLQISSAIRDIPETYALRSSVIGMMIGSSPIKGMTLGPRSGAQMEKAMDIGARNPRVWLMSGIGAINTPAMFGGGLDKAEAHLKKSIELFATDRPQAPAPGWGHNEAYAWLGQVYAKQNKIDDARASFMKALAIEPSDAWVKYSLLPALDKKK